MSFLNFPKNSIIIPAPTSKPKTSENHDSRIRDTLNLLLKYRPDLIIEDILDVTQELPTVHSEHGCRFPEDIIQYIAISNFHTSNIPVQVFIIDDIITTGGHFNAIKSALKTKYPDIKVIGVFWALHCY